MPKNNEGLSGRHGSDGKQIRMEEMMQDQKKLLDTIFESAVKNEMQYYGCSQAVLGTLKEHFKEVSPDVFTAGSALAGGVARQGETCGALIAAIMAIGSVIGRKRLEDLEQYQKAMEPATRAFAMFKEKVGHTLCSEIHQSRFGKAFRLYIPEEREEFELAGGHKREGCPEVCGIAARIAAEVILEIKEGS